MAVELIAEYKNSLALFGEIFKCVSETDIVTGGTNRNCVWESVIIVE